MKHILSTLLLSALLSNHLTAQDFSFACHPKFEPRTSNWYGKDPTVRKGFDSLSRVDYNVVDFELRIMSVSSGQLGMGQTLFVMRHDTNDVWKAWYFYYDFISTSEGLKRLEAYRQLDTINLPALWDSLHAANILNITTTPQDEVRRRLKEKYPNNPAYEADFQVSSSHPTRSFIDIATKYCKRNHFFMDAYLTEPWISVMDDYRSFSAVINIISAAVK